MSAIKEALERLDDSIGGLEESLTALETAPAGGGQPDMFSSMPSGNGKMPNGSNGYGVDSAAMAQKLDSAIEKVEAILKEA